MRKQATSDESLDPTLRSILGPGLDAPEPAALERGRERVRGLLQQQPERRGWGRRAGLAALGGGGVWTAMVGTAAAHKVAAGAIALGMIASGVVAVEPSHIGGLGIGPLQALTGGADEIVTGEALEGLAVSEAAEHDEGQGARVLIADADGLPGNLAERVLPTGRFSARGQLVSYSGDAVLVRLASGSEVSFILGDAAVVIPGPPAERSLLNHVGGLVTLQGSCPGETIGSDCTLERLSALGSAGTDASPGSSGATGGQGTQGAQASDNDNDNDNDEDQGHGGPPVTPPGLNR